MCIRDRPYTDVPFDVHLMVERPSRYFQDYLDIGMIFDIFLPLLTLVLTYTAPVSYTHLDVYKRQELNFCVRYGNRWTLSVINTNLLTFVSLLRTVLIILRARCV